MTPTLVLQAPVEALGVSAESFDAVTDEDGKVRPTPLAIAILTTRWLFPFCTPLQRGALFAEAQNDQ
jgi:hypothetical protein